MDIFFFFFDRYSLKRKLTGDRKEIIDNTNHMYNCCKFSTEIQLMLNTLLSLISNSKFMIVIKSNIAIKNINPRMILVYIIYMSLFCFAKILINTLPCIPNNYMYTFFFDLLFYFFSFLFVRHFNLFKLKTIQTINLVSTYITYLISDLGFFVFA